MNSLLRMIRVHFEGIEARGAKSAQRTEAC